MVRTHGLTHIALAVRDAERSLRFYAQVFGVVAVYRQKGFIQAQTPGSRDVLVFEESVKRAGKAGGVAHFGFRLVHPVDIGIAARREARRWQDSEHRRVLPWGTLPVLQRPGRIRGRDLVRVAYARRSPGPTPARKER